MAVGRLQAALASATNEVTVAAANLNFDFTLVKYEAPKEYQALGNLLSAKRKDNAELGSSHKLARQLGALFDGICPATPRLLEAYGTRVSEIAKEAKNVSEPYVKTVFGEYTGIDATSIWAAATSSKSALHVHLLGCLLARMWTAPEATSIWAEIVAERKKDIANKVEQGEPVHFSLAAATGQEISRSQLAMWDDSVRAWLRTADDVMKSKQKQLELILKNIELPVNNDLKVFPSVMKAWVVAVTAMENLVSGMPQAVQSGASLLGLSSWHLYPDMSVFSPKLVQVQMNDPLISAGGILSLGLSAMPQNSESTNGVYWSLSLAQLRHYGRPVKVERALQTEARITFSQLRLIAFAALLHQWKIDEESEELVARLVADLVDYVYSVPEGSTADRSTLQLLKDAVLAYLEDEPTDQDMKHKLVHLGRRRAPVWIGYGTDKSETESTEVFFGLLDNERFMRLFDTVESRIQYLRYAAARLTNSYSPPGEFIIRYAPNKFSYVFATAIPLPSNVHHRWVSDPTQVVPYPDGDTSTPDAQIIFTSEGKYSFKMAQTPEPESFTYEFLMGDHTEAALFRRRTRNPHYIGDVSVTLNDLKWCIESKLLSPYLILSDMLYGSMTREIKFLYLLSLAGHVYENLPGATINVGILNKPFLQTEFAKSWVRYDLDFFYLANIFSLIAYFESGVHEVNPEQLKSVIALSSTNSLFVAQHLMQDPYNSFQTIPEVCRILGNVGKPGITFLLPPQEPMIREQDPNSWKVNSYLPLDGTPASSFADTSVHLSFTEYHVPMYDGSHGAHDNQISFLESVISVRDKGIWVADVDPLPLVNELGSSPIKLARSPIRALSPQSPCLHTTKMNPNKSITVIDTWDELLDKPDGVVVVRTGDNWVARLASTLVIQQRMRKTTVNYDITVCPVDVCWTCLDQKYGQHEHKFREHIYIY